MKFFIVLSLVIVSYSQYIWNNRIVYGDSAAVVSSSKEASEIALQVLKDGGNAYDASIAMAFAMAVSYPEAGNLGGGGFLLSFTKDGNAFSLDYREKAPLNSYKNMYLDKNGNVDSDKSTLGFSASGVPGTVDGMWTVHQKFGSLPWSRLVTPAAELAEKGFILTAYSAEMLNGFMKELDQYPNRFHSTRKIFYKNGGFKRGDLLIQNDLAKTLKRIAQNGRNEFYTGETAQLIAKDMKTKKGNITLSDLKKYQSKFREVIRFTLRDSFEVISMPPPSSGGVALFGILKSFERYQLQNFPYMSANYIQLFTEICRQVYADRAEFLGDPDFVKVPLNKLLSSGYIDSLTSRIRFGKDHKNSKDINALKSLVYESDHTTHFNIVDKYGNVVSNTYTLNNSFGCYDIVESAGFLMNNEMDDFSAKPGTANLYGLLGNEMNAIQAEKRMLSSMTPSIVLKNGKPFLSFGSPGGSTIITTVAQAIIRSIFYTMNIDDAVNLGRVHHQWYPDVIAAEKNAISADTEAILKRWGYQINYRNSIGDCHGILMENGKLMIGVSNRDNGFGAAY